MALPPKDEKVKRLGDEVLNQLRDWLNRECQDATFRFLDNRWVYWVSPPRKSCLPLAAATSLLDLLESDSQGC